VIAAGSTGSMPATAVALPPSRGCRMARVVPGLDMELDDALALIAGKDDDKLTTAPAAGHAHSLVHALLDRHRHFAAR
jgi:hypothetical protein